MWRTTSPKLRSTHFSYEKAGLTVADEPVPWNAEAVLVDVVVRLPLGTLPRKQDFQLRTPDHVPRLGIALHPAGDESTVRVVFRLPPIQSETRATVHYQGKIFGQVLLTFLPANAFLRQVCLRAPTIFALLGKHSVACQTLVEGQCRGLSAGGVLASPTSLLPLCDFDLRVEIADAGTGCSECIRLPLSASQLVCKETPLTFLLPMWARAMGTRSIRWFLGDELLARAELRVLSPATVQQALYLAEGGFVSQGKEGTALFRHHLLARDDTRNLRPGFLISGREPGLASLCTFEVRVQFRDPSRRPALYKLEMLVTDRASLCAPDLSAIADFPDVRAFELLCQGQILGVLPVRPTPVAAFTSEGAFRAAADFDWTPFTEEELFDRLERLIETGAAAQETHSQGQMSHGSLELAAADTGGSRPSSPRSHDA